jgi:hypothetical protein
MEPLLIIVVPGVIGGVVLALCILRLHGRPDPSEPSTRLAPPSPSLINMARIRINGVGGFGMLAMAISVAIFVPRIRTTMALALILGTGLAALMIARRRNGPLPSSSEHAGAHSTMFTDIEG